MHIQLLTKGNSNALSSQTIHCCIYQTGAEARQKLFRGLRYLTRAFLKPMPGKIYLEVSYTQVIYRAEAAARHKLFV